MKNLIAAMFLVLCVGSAHSAAVNARGGKKAIGRTADGNGYPITFNDDKPWKVFESTTNGASLLLDENGVAPKQGMIRQVCISSGAASTFAVVYDSNTTAGLSIASTGVKLIPQVNAITTGVTCVTPNALFTSGAVVETNGAVSPGGVYVYWRELGGFR